MLVEIVMELTESYGRKIESNDSVPPSSAYSIWRQIYEGGVHALISLLRIEQTIWSEYLNPFSGNNNNTPPTSATTTSANTNTPATYNNTGVNATNSLIIGNQNVTTTLLENSLALRRYICMALTNLTYATIDNKAFICRRIANLEVLLAQLETGNEELKQVKCCSICYCYCCCNYILSFYFP
ncbi:unnamed protein product [Trichobilharzia regenti]|nr:unnamed protein product [Trichobilharzia regenti]